MGSRICDHLRSNVVGYIAIFLFATGGTAIALDGSNTVFSDDIVNGEVTSPDVLNNSLSTNDLGPDSVGSSEVANNSLKAADLGPNVELRSPTTRYAGTWHELGRQPTRSPPARSAATKSPTRTPSGRRLTATRSARRSRHFAPVRFPVRCSLRSAAAPWA